MTFHVMLFSFLVSKCWNQISSTVTFFSTKSLPLAACHWSNYDFPPFCTCLSAVGEPNNNKLSNIPKSFSSPAWHCGQWQCGCATISLTITIQSLVKSASTFWSLHSMMTVLGQLMWGRLAMFLLPFFEVYSQHYILLAPMQESPQVW